MISLKKIVLIGLAIAGIVSCKKKKEDDPKPVEETKTTTIPIKQQFLETYANVAYVSFTEAKAKAEALQLAINAFVESPSEAKFTACKVAYKTARIAYLQCEVFRGPVGNPLDFDGAEGLINSWPLDEAYIDFTFDPQGASVVNTDTVKIVGQMQGYVNDRSKTIDAPSLVGLNGEGGDANISVGFHAIEFLLWGQDIYTDSPGKRPYTDYLQGTLATAPNGGRRGEYLKVCASLLTDILGQIINKWKPDVSGNYRADFLLSSKTDFYLKGILSGMIKLSKGEFGGERILPALEEGSTQEEEHSCFSDLTKDDFKYDVIGFENIFKGVYKQQTTGISLVNSVGLNKVISDVNAEKGNNLASSMDNLKSTTEAVFNATLPYDQLILLPAGNSEKAKVQTMSNAWVNMSENLNAANVALGYEIVNPDEE